jgi:hypothetical protein
MRLRDGTYERANCGAALAVSTGAVPLVIIKMGSGAEPVRSITYRGEEVHCCPLQTTNPLEAP